MRCVLQTPEGWEDSHSLEARVTTSSQNILYTAAENHGLLWLKFPVRQGQEGGRQTDTHTQERGVCVCWGLG